MPPEPRIEAAIDERFLVEWFEFGWNELVSYLSKWAAFRRYEAAHPEQETDVQDA